MMNLRLVVPGLGTVVLKDQEVDSEGNLSTRCTRCGCFTPTQLRLVDGVFRSVPQCNTCRHRYPRKQPTTPPGAPFPVGQKVRCEDASDTEPALEKGRVYVVRGYHEDIFSEPLVLLRGVKSEGYYARRFVAA